jgi:threonine/homoserine/homoserine lactone efflux protein
VDYPLFALTGIAGTSFTLALSGALMPGPLLTVTVAEAARRGARAGPLVITGHAILELLLVIIIINGVGPYLQAPPVIGTISLLGGIILFVMGVDMVRRASTLSLRQDMDPDSQRTFGHPVLLGVVGSLANPYWTLWWVTIGLGYMATAKHFGVPGLVAFFLGHIAADYGWYFLVALGISRSRTIFRDDSYQAMILICGVFLVGFGVWFLSSAFQHLGDMLL